MAKKRTTTTRRIQKTTRKVTPKMSKQSVRSSVSSSRSRAVSSSTATQQLKAKLDAQKAVKPSQTRVAGSVQKPYLGNRIPLQKLATQGQLQYSSSNNSKKKMLIIGGIALIAVLLLSLFLLFSGQLAGRAFYTGNVNTAGIVAPSNPISPSNPFVLDVTANIGTAETISIQFQLLMDPALDCSNYNEVIEGPALSLWGTSSTLGQPVARCTDTPTGSVIDFDYATSNILNTQTGEFLVAQIFMNPISSSGTYNFNFNSFDIYSFHPTNSVDLITNGLSDPIVVQECTLDAHCIFDPALSVCDSTGTSPTYTCVAPATTVPVSGASCASDADCISGEMCSRGGLCVPTSGDCLTDNDCVAPQTCDTVGNVCVDPTTTPSFETACDDGVDEDADGALDCADSDCASDPVCTAPPTCSATTFGACATETECIAVGAAWNPTTSSCVQRCDTITPSCPTGNVCDSATGLCVASSSLPTTCGDGVFDPAVEICDPSATPQFTTGVDCTNYDPASPFVGGVLSCDATCQYDTLQCTSTLPPLATEAICDDGVDDDSDGPIDCQDVDCTGDPACQNLAGGAACVADSMCASGTCSGTTATCVSAGTTPTTPSTPTVNFRATLASETGAVIPQMTIYTTLYDANNVILAFKREVVRDVTSYDALISYNPTGTNYVAQREILVQDAPASQATRNFARIVFDYSPDASGVLTENLNAAQTTEQGIFLN